MFDLSWHTKKLLILRFKYLITIKKYEFIPRYVVEIFIRNYAYKISIGINNEINIYDITTTYILQKIITNFSFCQTITFVLFWEMNSTVIHGIFAKLIFVKKLEFHWS